MNRLIVLVVILAFFKTEAQPSVLNIADSLYVNGNFSEAIKTYKLYGDMDDISSKLARSYQAIGNYDKALDHYQKGIKVFPDNALLKYEYAKLLSKTKNYQTASSVFKQLIALDSLHPNYHYELGLVYEKLGDSLMHSEYKKSFQLDSGHQKAIFKLAKRQIQIRNYDSTTYYLNVGLKTFENNGALINLKAQNYYFQKDYKKATIWFEKLLGLGEDSQFVHEKLSYCYSQISEVHKAIEQQKLAIAKEPRNSKNLYILGELYTRIDDYKQGEHYIKKSIELVDLPLDYEYMKLGTIQNHQNKYKEAIQSFQSALKENPDNHYVAFYLVFTQDKYYKDVDSKIKLYENFIAKYPKNPFLFKVKSRLSELKEEKFMNLD
ncbi:tetratricopeptide repeat protein [Bizionia argentinensis JUB59]|uniref:Tetratricopeptide repeat protein n=1 Tax=Bizionia argentinensis JUB59 TaxID=1046627 RepID=G2EAJ9_9FLAO|nr:tetratricopeptide repeat protein [Bizionia argentinensis]EGV44584.1 tetratricopeptide repeat protein [Bizionia argentinensis JUB59]